MAYTSIHKINEIKTIERLTVEYGWLRLVVAWERKSSKERAKIFVQLVENKMAKIQGVI